MLFPNGTPLTEAAIVKASNYYMGVVGWLLNTLCVPLYPNDPYRREHRKICRQKNSVWWLTDADKAKVFMRAWKVKSFRKPEFRKYA